MTATGIVTSTTRPTDPDVGDRIFETDTGKVLYWYGFYYRWLPQWGAGGRLLGWAEGTSPIGSNNDALTLTIDNLLIQGRKLYWIANFPVQRASGVTGTFQITDENNVNLTDRNLSVSTLAVLQSSVTVILRELISPTWQFDVTRKLRVINGTIPSGTTYNLFCFDEGPAQAIGGNIPVWDTATWDSSVWGL